MDTGHHNCRDYHLPIPTSSIAAAVLNSRVSTISRPSLPSRGSQPSPLNRPAKRVQSFPFFHLPYEIRQQVYSYVLPHTITQHDARPTLRNAAAKCITVLPPSWAAVNDNVHWVRGNTALLAVSRLVHDEYAALFYGDSTFVLYVSYDKIQFRYRWLLPSGLMPSAERDFLDFVPHRYIRLIKRLVVTVDHVGSYMGMIKYNVGGIGLTHGLRAQVARLAEALQPDNRPDTERSSNQGVKHIGLRLVDGSDPYDVGNSRVSRFAETSKRSIVEIETVLQPFAQLRGLLEVNIVGAVTDDFSSHLRRHMMSSCLDLELDNP